MLTLYSYISNGLSKILESKLSIDGVLTTMQDKWEIGVFYELFEEVVSIVLSVNEDKDRTFVVPNKVSESRVLPLS